MTYFWFLIFLLKINEITVSELFNIKDCKKRKGLKMKEETLYPSNHRQWYQSSYFSKPSLLTWSGSVQKHSTSQFKGFLPLVLFGSGAMESAVGWDARGCNSEASRSQKNFLRRSCLSTFMNLANWRPPHWDQCLPEIRYTGWVCSPSAVSELAVWLQVGV